jgi:hypothetical protein
VLQAVEVGSNCSLKTEFNQQLMEEIAAMLQNLAGGDRSKAEVLRSQMVSAFLNLFRAVTTPANLYNAFEAAGFS